MNIISTAGFYRQTCRSQGDVCANERGEAALRATSPLSLRLSVRSRSLSRLVIRRRLDHRLLLPRRPGRLARGGLADAAGAADGLLLERRLLRRVVVGDEHGLGGVGGVQVGADLLGQPLG